MGPGTCVVRKGFMEVKGQKRKKSDAEGLRPGKQRERRLSVWDVRKRSLHLIASLHQWEEFKF